MKTMHRIMQLWTSVSKNSLSINRKISRERWIIHPFVDKKTVKHTKQRGVIILCPHPSLMKLMLTNDRMLGYKRLPYNVFSNSLISGSKRVNKYAYVCASYFGWA